MDNNSNQSPFGRVYRHNLLDHRIADRMTQRTGIPTSVDMLNHLAKHMRGPLAQGYWTSGEDGADLWLDQVGLLRSDYPDAPSLTEIHLRDEDQVRPIWMVAGEHGCPQLHGLAQSLERCGAECVYVTDMLEAARIAASGEVDGAVIEMTGHIEAFHFLAAILLFKGRPYIALTHHENPLGFALGGVELRAPVSDEEIWAALESLPTSKTRGLNLEVFMRTR